MVYCSATGASSVKNLAYMVRLGLWGPETAFEDFGTFNSAIEKAGYGGMVPGCDRAHQPWAPSVNLMLTSLGPHVIIVWQGALASLEVSLRTHFAPEVIAGYMCEHCAASQQASF